MNPALHTPDIHVNYDITIEGGCARTSHSMPSSLASCLMPIKAPAAYILHIHATTTDFYCY